MKKLSMLLLLIALSLTPIRAQTIPATANLTASDSGACTTAGACLTVNVTPSSAAAVIQLTGTFSATLQFEGTTSQGGTFVAIAATPVAGGSAVTSATATGSWRVTASGFAQIRVRCSAFTSGTVVAAITLSTGSSGTSGAGSGGTVTAVTGTSPIASSGGTAPAISCPTCFTSGAPPTLDQIGNPAVSKTFALGSTQPLTFTDAGVFTNAQQNEDFETIVGASCPISTIVGATTKITDALMGCINIPSGAGVTNGFSNAVSAYVINNNSSSLGQFGKAIGVGVYPAVNCAANNTKCIGVAPQVESAGSLSGVFLEGEEVGVQPNNTTDQGYGILLSFEGGGAQPTGDNLPGVVIQTPSTAATFTTGFECNDGSVSTSNCMAIGKTASGSGHNSQSIQFNTTNSAAQSFTSSFGLNQDNIQILTSQGISINNVAAEESYGILLTSTAALAHGTLVKIDSAHADSVVVCATTDTQCQGFVQGTNSSPNGLCVASSVACAIVTHPGSKVQGVLGTGTCAIDNPSGTRAFVIADTTTAGRIKCTTSQPAVGAYIGLAISSQNTVGNLVDILTKFQ